MQKIWNKKDKRWENVKCLKKLVFSSQPGKKFFLHRSFESKGFTVTELQTGASICHERESMQEAIKDAEWILESVSKEKFQSMIDQVLLKQVEYEMQNESISPSFGPFLEDRTGEPEEFREEDL